MGRWAFFQRVFPVSTSSPSCKCRFLDFWPGIVDHRSSADMCLVFELEERRTTGTRRAKRSLFEFGTRAVRVPNELAMSGTRIIQYVKKLKGIDVFVLV